MAPRVSVMHNRGSRGEVAEPGLRRTPGTRVDSKGSRGFESPPLRHPVSDSRDFFALMPKDACVRDILPLKGTGEMANSSRSLKSQVFSLRA